MGAGSGSVEVDNHEDPALRATPHAWVLVKGPRRKTAPESASNSGTESMYSGIVQAAKFLHRLVPRRRVRMHRASEHNLKTTYDRL